MQKASVCVVLVDLVEEKQPDPSEDATPTWPNRSPPRVASRLTSAPDSDRRSQEQPRHDQHRHLAALVRPRTGSAAASSPTEKFIADAVEELITSFDHTDRNASRHDIETATRPSARQEHHHRPRTGRLRWRSLSGADGSTSATMSTATSLRLSPRRCSADGLAEPRMRYVYDPAQAHPDAELAVHFSNMPFDASRLTFGVYETCSGRSSATAVRVRGCPTCTLLYERRLRRAQSSRARRGRSSVSARRSSPPTTTSRSPTTSSTVGFPGA